MDCCQNYTTQPTEKPGGLDIVPEATKVSVACAIAKHTYYAGLVQHSSAAMHTNTHLVRGQQKCRKHGTLRVGLPCVVARCLIGPMKSTGDSASLALPSYLTTKLPMQAVVAESQVLSGIPSTAPRRSAVGQWLASSLQPQHSPKPLLNLKGGLPPLLVNLAGLVRST